jgi:hypothetical protein
MDSNLLNFMLKAKEGRGFQNLSHLWDRVFGYWQGILRFLFFNGIDYMISRLVFFGRMSRDVRLFYFPLGPEVVFVGTGIGLFSLN